MNIFTLAVIIGLLTLLVALALMWIMVNLSQAVTTNEAVIEAQEKVRKSVNPNQTAGLPIPTAADYQTQLFDARRLAAKIAAGKKRGENMGIGRLGTTDARKDKKHTAVGVEDDPLSAVKIAKFHSWNGLDVVKAAPAAGPVVTGGATKTVKRKLVPGKDFQWVEFKGLSGAAKRQAVIANGKAKYAAYKAAKAAGLDTVTVAAGGTPATGVAPVAAAPAIELPPAPTLVKIVDGMDPAEKRKAMIANSKAKSAYNKQLKSLDIDPKEVEWTDDGPKLPDTAQAAVDAARAAAPVVTATPASVTAAPATGAVTLPPFDGFTVITDDMDPADVRKARIGNSKAKSAYNKELKAAGIDPKTIEWNDNGPVLKAAAPAAVAPAPAAQAATPAPTAAAPAASNVPPSPEMIEITDGMAPEEIRAARIANSKAKSAYKKELKALGIDPKSVEI